MIIKDIWKSEKKNMNNNFVKLSEKFFFDGFLIGKINNIELIEKLNSIFKESLLIQRSAPRCVIECHGGNNAIIFQEKANERSGILWKIEIH